MKKYYVFRKGLHEYTIKVKEKKNGKVKYSLYYSDAEHWRESCRGTKSITVIEDDLEFTIKGMSGKAHYHEVFELQMLLSFMGRNYSEEKYEIIEANPVQEV